MTDMISVDEWLRPDWPVSRNVRTLVTTRSGGISKGIYASFNLGAHVGDDPVAVAENRRRLRHVAALPAEPIWLNQVHGQHVVELDKSLKPSLEADAATTGSSGVVCAVLTADCLPVFFCDRAGTRIAVAHAGWRGLSLGVLESTVVALGVPPENVLAWLGPAIGHTVFEVGEEVRAVFVEDSKPAMEAFKPSPGGRWLADLYALARLRLASAGVTEVYGGGLCTYTDAGRFYSYRRDGATGRMASLIWLEG